MVMLVGSQAPLLEELPEQPRPVDVLAHVHTLASAICDNEASPWLRERLVDVLFYDRRRLCWELPALLPPMRALPSPDDDARAAWRNRVVRRAGLTSFARRAS